MFKRIWFAPGPAGDFARDASRAALAPGDARPVRVTACVALPDFGPSVHDAIGTAWFTDIDHLTLFENWCRSSSPAVVAEEAVLRGADWLERRWREGGEKVKHMAVAVRADGLTREEFSELWRHHAGSVGGKRIPDEARGLAYVQNHAISGPCDAVNEVYFDDVAGLRKRVEWFDANPPADGLFGKSWLMSVVEVVCG